MMTDPEQITRPTLHAQYQAAAGVAPDASGLTWIPLDEAELEVFRADYGYFIEHVRGVASYHHRRAPFGERYLATFASGHEAARILGAARLEQTCIEAFDVVQVRMALNDAERLATFFRRHDREWYPTLLPILSDAGNFFSALEGRDILRISADNVREYAALFVNEAVVGHEGQFTFFPTFQALSERLRVAAIATLTSGRPGEMHGADPAEDDQDSPPQTEADDALEAWANAKILGAVEAPGGGVRCIQRGFATYGFMTYANALFAVDMAIDAITGTMRMVADLPLVVDPDPPPPGPARVAAALVPAFESRFVDFRREHGVEIVTAEDAVRRLTSATLTNVVVQGGIEIASAQLSALGIRDCFILGDVRVRHTVVERGTIAVTGTRISGDLDLSGSRAEGSIGIDATEILGSCILSYARVGGNIEVGVAEHQSVSVGGVVDLSGCRVGGDVTLGIINTAGAVQQMGGAIGGMLRLGPPHGAFLFATPAVGAVSLAHCEIKGPVALRGIMVHRAVRLESCDLGAVTTEACLNFDRGVTIRADGLVDMNGGTGIGELDECVMADGMVISGCSIRGEVRFSGTRFRRKSAPRNAVDISNTRIGQGVLFWDELLGEARSADGLADFLAELKRPPAGAELDDTALMSFQPPPAPEPLIWSIREVADKDGRHLRLESEAEDRPFWAPMRSAAVRTTLEGDLNVHLCEIGGDCCLTNVSAPGQRLRFRSVTINGSLLAEREPARYAGWLSTQPAQPDPISTTALALDVEGARIRTDVAVPGLRLHSDEHQRSMRLVSSRVDGIVRLTDDTVDEPVRNRVATFDMHCDISRSRIDHFILDGRTLGGGEREKRWFQRLVRGVGRRARAIAGLFLVARPPAADGEQRLIAGGAVIRRLDLIHPLPATFDLDNAHVALWKFPNANLDNFESILERQRPFSRGLYQAIESHLQERGLEEEAKRIRRRLIAARGKDELWGRRDFEASRPRRIAGFVDAAARRIFSIINGVLTQNFTSAWRPLQLWGLTFAFASAVFMDPRLVEIDTNRYFADRVELCRMFSEWSTADAAKFSTRYVLPVIDAVGMEDLAAADRLQNHGDCAQPPRVAGWPSLARLRPEWVRPSTLATAVRLFSWMLLSLATATIFSKMSEGREHPEPVEAE